MRIRHLLAALMTVLAVSGANFLAFAPSAAARTATESDCSNAYFGADSRLGPEILPDGGPIAPMVRRYHRLAGLSASQFLATYWDSTAGSWIYPPDNGFLLLKGHPDEHPVILMPGRHLDRFGSEYGAFLAPADTPYAARSLPPQSLDNFDPAYTCNYHAYRVLKRFAAEGGPIAPGFGQPGLGTQYQLVSSLLPGRPSANVMWLITHGYLQRLN